VIFDYFRDLRLSFFGLVRQVSLKGDYVVLCIFLDLLYISFLEVVLRKADIELGH
jgi:hypothetical protein